MNLNEALDEVVVAAKQPKQFPPGVTPLPSPCHRFNEDNSETGSARVANARPGDGLPLGVGNLCQHYKAWEPFEAGFLFGLQRYHQSAMRATGHVFSEFLGRHRSLNKRELLASCADYRREIPKTLKGTRARPMTSGGRDIESIGCAGMETDSTCNTTAEVSGDLVSDRVLQCPSGQR